MSAVGSYLRNLREQQGVSLEELARATRVLYRHLQALEADDLEALPAPVFTKGFIRAYCQVLGVAPDEALALYDPRPREGRPAAQAPVPSPTPAPRVQAAAAELPRTPRGHGAVLVSFALLVVLGVALFAFTVAFKSGQEAGVGQRSPVASAPPPSTEASPEPSPVVEPPAPSPPPPAKPSVSTPPGGAPSMATPAVAASAPAVPQAAASPASSYRLVARTTETTWMRVRTEDGRTIEETIPANEVREWVSNYPFVLSIGNAGGVTLELNGRPIPRLGASGAVITRLVLPSEPQ
jgi:cytoskeleton protein RodZ